MINNFNYSNNGKFNDYENSFVGEMCKGSAAHQNFFNSAGGRAVGLGVGIGTGLGLSGIMQGLFGFGMGGMANSGAMSNVFGSILNNVLMSIGVSGGMPGWETPSGMAAQGCCQKGGGSFGACGMSGGSVTASQSVGERFSGMVSNRFSEHGIAERNNLSGQAIDNILSGSGSPKAKAEMLLAEMGSKVMQSLGDDARKNASSMTRLMDDMDDRVDYMASAIANNDHDKLIEEMAYVYSDGLENSPRGRPANSGFLGLFSSPGEKESPLRQIARSIGTVHSEYYEG